MAPMTIELTPQQQTELDHPDESPRRVVDPRTRTVFVLVPGSEYDAMREKALRAIALGNAARRLE